MSNSTQKSYPNKKISVMGTITIPFLLLATLIKPLVAINVIVDSEAIISHIVIMCMILNV